MLLNRFYLLTASSVCSNSSTFPAERLSDDVIQCKGDYRRYKKLQTLEIKNMKIQYFAEN